jgi:hypothetical protein
LSVLSLPLPAARGRFGNNRVVLQPEGLSLGRLQALGIFILLQMASLPRIAVLGGQCASEKKNLDIVPAPIALSDVDWLQVWYGLCYNIRELPKCSNTTGLWACGGQWSCILPAIINRILDFFIHYLWGPTCFSVPALCGLMAGKAVILTRP